MKNSKTIKTSLLFIRTFLFMIFLYIISSLLMLTVWGIIQGTKLSYQDKLKIDSAIIFSLIWSTYTLYRHRDWTRVTLNRGSTFENISLILIQEKWNMSKVSETKYIFTSRYLPFIWEQVLTLEIVNDSIILEGSKELVDKIMNRYLEKYVRIKTS